MRRNGSRPDSAALGPSGRQRTPGSSRPYVSARALYTFCAQGSMSVVVMLVANPRPSIDQTPERSGFPFAVRGGGAVRLGLPSAVRGIPGVGTSSHCAAAGVTEQAAANTAMATREESGIGHLSGNDAGRLLMV